MKRRLRHAWRTRTDRLLAEADGASLGTRRRAVPVAAAGLIAMVTMFSLVSQNALAVNFASATNAHQVWTDKLSGTDAAGFLSAQERVGGDKPAAQFGFNEAVLNGLCLAATETVPLLGEFSLVILAGETVDGTVQGGDAINANQLFFSTDDLAANGDEIAKLTLGQAANTLTMGSYGSFAGNSGGFGLQAQTMNLSNLDGKSYGIDLQGQINLPQMRIKVVPGSVTKGQCQTL